MLFKIKQERTTSCSEKEITHKKDINTELNLFEPKINISNALIQDSLNCIETD